MPSRSQEIYVAEHILKQREERRRRKDANGGILPDDRITMIVFVDAYNWRGCAPYFGVGMGLIMRPQRRELGAFYSELRREYRAFAIRERLEERIKERDARDEEEIGDGSNDGAEAVPTAKAPPDVAQSIIAPVTSTANTVRALEGPTDVDFLAAWGEKQRELLGPEQLSDMLARTLALAAAQAQVVTIEYWGGSTPGRIRDIRPLAVFRVPGYDGIYIHAIDMERNEERNYRLDRLKLVDPC